MYSWSEILAKLIASREGDAIKFDDVRRGILAELHAKTGRNVIIYISHFTHGEPQRTSVSISDEDVQGLMEVLHGLRGPSLDLVIHSPGGSIEAAEGFVEYLRSKFDDIRVVVPQVAFSAAAMICCAANKIVMGKHSFLGPTDPQILLPTPLGPRWIPAQAITAQFDKAVELAKTPARKSELTVWLPMLNQYGPDLLVQCENFTKLGTELIEQWLASHMFNGEADGPQKARDIAGWLGTHDNFKTHGRHISRKQLAEKGLKIAHLEDSQDEQDLFLGVFHATTHTLNGSAAVKIIENHLGNAFIKQKMVIQQVSHQGPPTGLVLPT